MRRRRVQPAVPDRDGGGALAACTRRPCASTTGSGWSARGARPGQSRRYSMRDVAQLREIARLCAEGLNLEGVHRILELEDQVTDLALRVRELESALAEEVLNRPGRRMFAAGTEGEVASLRAGSRAKTKNQVVIWRPFGRARIGDRWRTCRAPHLGTAGGAEDAARAVRRRPHGDRPERQARPGDRARRRDPSRQPGAHPAHQEQPGAHRRAGRRQDRRGRRARPAHRRGRRGRLAEEQAARLARPLGPRRRREVPRRVRGAAEGRAQRDQRLRRPDHHLHRRAAHPDGRRRRRGRSRPRTC